MSKQESDTHLKFGQGVLIKGFKTEGNDQGFLTAQGFADIKAKYQTYDELLYFKNYRNSIFQILPAGNFELNDQLQKALIENEGQEETSNIRILKNRAESQKYQFQLNIQNNMKKKVGFGQNVIFKHIDSESYISGTIKPSTGSNGAFTVQVSEKLSQSLVFKLLPFRSFQFLDMPIPFDSPILIRNQFNNGFLTFQKIGMGDQGKSRSTYIQKKPIESNDSYKIPVKTLSQKSEVYEIVTHFVDLSCERQAPMPWRFKLHVNDVVNDTLIQHDVVYLKHTENGGVLSTNGRNIILKELKEQDSDQLCFYECLWEIEKHDASDDAYILRHLMSGMVLGKELSEDSMRRAVLQDISEGKVDDNEIGYIEVKLAKKEGGVINSESFVNIACGDQLLETHDQQQNLQESLNKNSNEGRVDLWKMKYLYKKDIEYNIRPLIFKKSVTQEHCFIIMEIDDVLKKELLFALSFHSVIIRLREDLQWGAIEAAKKISYLRMMQVTSKIKQIKNFIKDCTDEQAELEHIFPVYKRQMICKDLGISQLLFELLYFMRMNLKEDIFSDKHNQRQKFLELYNTLYEVINELVRNNRLFKMHISKWFEFILEDVIANNQTCQLNLIKELLRDNDFFVDNFVNREIIEYLTEHCMIKNNNPDYIEKKYLQIFRLFCITGKKVNTSNQKLILDYFLKKLNDSRSLFEVQIVEDRDSILIVASLDKENPSRLSFEQFYLKCHESHQSTWEYFVQYLNLIADLAQGRNKITQIELSQVYTLKILGDLFETQNLREAEVPIIRLIHYLYAESQNFYPIQKKRKILNYNTLAASAEQISIHSTPSDLKPWEPPFDRILARLLTKLKEYGPIDPSQIRKNETLFTLLKFLWETINLGFWHDKSAAKEILGDVLNVLAKNQVIGDYKQVMKQSKQNILMIECKMECLNIIDLITEVDNDVFVQFIASRFKEFEFPQKKFSLKGMLSSTPMFEIRCNHPMVHKFLAMLPTEESIQPIIETSICDQMIEMSNYNNAQLTSKAISIIDRVLQTRRKAFNQFSELIIISEQERLKLLSFMEFHRNKFFIMEDSNIVNVSQDNQVCNYFMVYDEANIGLMEVMYLLTELMKNQNSILSIENIKSIHEVGIFAALGSNRLINFTGERSSTSRMKQQIVYSSNLHLKVLNFIFSCKQLPQSQLALKLLHLSYYFIVSLIENFNQIKALMQWHIPKLIHHIKKNVGCIDFLKQMYDNNKTMLYNQSAVFDLIKQICQNIQNEDENSYYRSKLLDFYRYLIYCNGRSLKNHQIQILKIMQDDSYKNIMNKITKQQIEEMIIEYERDNKDSQQIIMGAKLTYICTFFQLMAALIDNNNVVNIGKLIKRYPFQDLLGYLMKSGTCWPLKRNIRCFINRLYYFRPDIDTQLKNILSYQLKNIIDDLDSYIQAKYDPNVAIQENKKFKNPVRFSYLESYHYLLIEQTFFTIFNLITRQKLVKQTVKYLNEFVETDLKSSHNWYKITERMGWLQKFFTLNKNIYSKSMIKFILSKAKSFLLQLDKKTIYEQGIPADFKLDSNDSASPIDKQQLRAAIDKTIQGNINIYYEQRHPAIHEDLPLSFIPQSAVKEEKVVNNKQRDQNKLKEVLRTIFRREKRDFQNQDQHICYNLQQLISSIKLSPEAQAYTYGEYLQKVETYYNRSDKFDYVYKIIELNSKDPTALTSQRKIFFLQFITGLVEMANRKKEEQPKEGEQEKPKEEAAPEEAPAEEGEEQGMEFKKDIDEWDAEDWSGNAKEIVKTQKNLKKCELGKFIVQLLKEDIINNIELANSILLCSISYLLGGNTLTQKNIIQQLQKDGENKVFQNIEALIFKLGKLIRKNIDESNTQQDQGGSADFTPSTVDNYDYYDVNQKFTLRKNVFEPNSTDQYLYNKLCITTYRRAFKFLQLLCENNNKQGKNFIRVQPGKSRQFNFIDITTKQLRNLFQIFCNEIKEVPLFLLDFILQVTQIPIYQNQQALMNSTFFQDLCALKNTFNLTTNPHILEERNFKTLTHVQEIYYKSIKIVLSNFQGNDQKTYQTLDSKMQPKFLVDILKQKLVSMKITSQEQLVKHITDFSNQTEEDGRKKTDFSQDMLILLDIITIFLKMKDALHEQSRICNSYQKFKKQLYEEQKTAIANKLLDEGVAEAEKDAKAEQEMANYKCLYVHLEKCLLNIEITDDKGKDQVIYFPKYPVFSSLTGNLRDYIMRNVTRDSHRDKIVSLLGYTQGVKQKIEYSYNLKKIKKITQQNMNDSFKIASYLSIILCIYIGYFYHVIIEYQQAEYYTEFTIGAVRFALSIMQLTFTILFIFYWLELKLWFNPEPVSRSNAEEEEVQEVEETPAVEEEKGQGEPAGEEAPLSRLQIYKNKLKPLWQKFNEMMEKLMQELNSQEQKIYKNIQLWRIVLFLGSSLIGTFYFPPMFFLHLIDIFAQIQKLGTILYSAIYNAKSLVLVSVMGVFFTIIFCTVTFSNYMKNVYTSDDAVQDMCDGVMDCVTQLYVSGAIGQTMQSFQIMRFIYDIIYITFFDMLFSNIVSGLMLDAFSSLRQAADQLENDKKNNCYICNMSREALQKQGQDFTEHTKKKHFLWNYIFYIYVLERKDQTDYTGLQYYIKMQYYRPDEEMEVRWIPNKGQNQFDVETEASMLSEQLKKKMEEIAPKHTTLEESINEFKQIAKDYLE